MREIKFRAWDKLSKKMIEDVLNLNNQEKNNFGQVLKDKSKVVMQYTGLLDKNGKEIYEGDIIEFIEESYSFIGQNKKVKREVKWQDYYGAGWYFGSSNKDGEKRFSFSFPDCEIIGNIYENKELI